MKTIVLTCFLLYAFQAFGGSRITFMVESADHQKNVALLEPGQKDFILLTHGPLWHLYPRLSSDGSQIALSEGVDGQSLGIFTMNLKDHSVEQWTSQEGQFLHARFSGDGKYLAFSGPLGPNHLPQIGVINLVEDRKKPPTLVTEEDGHKKSVYLARIKILKSPYPCYFPAFSSDGSFVVYQRNISSGVRDIVLEDLQSEKILQISSPSGNSMSPALSFDNRTIAFTSKINNNWDVYLYDRASKETVRVTNNKAQDFAPTFAPDGAVAFASDRSGEFQLYRATGVDRGEDDSKYVKALVTGAASYYAPSFSGEMKIKQAKLQSMPAPARSSFGSVIVDDKVFAVGGHQGPEHNYPESSFTNRVDYFDLKDHEWHQAAPRKYAAHGFGLAAYRGYIYAFGGFTFAKELDPQWTSLDVIERYDLRKNIWSVVGKLPHKRSSNVVAQVGSKVYLIGGWDSTPKAKGDLDGTFHSSIDVFDLETETAFTTNIILPKPLRRAFTGVVLGSEIVLIGGIGQGASHFQLLSQVTALDTETGSFRELSPLPFGTFAPAAGVIGNSIFVFGGMLKEGQNDFAYINHIYALSPGKEWVSTGRYLSEDKGFSQVIQLGPKTLGILGGHNDEGEGAANGPLTSFETFGL
jgi:N-acetylneuraminic acid mutarotase